MDPFRFYARLYSAAADMARSGQRAAETLAASGDVVAKRSVMMKAAASAPLAADYAELNRMVPEKVEAFAQAGSAMVSGWGALQSTVAAHMQQLGAMALRGRPPTVAELIALSSRNMEFAVSLTEHFSAAGGKGLRPIHARATANARRLKRARR
jgi:hypothetical protein